MSAKGDASFDPVWEEVFRAQEWGKYPPEHVIRAVARNFYKAPDRKAVKILDIGSGPGANTWYVAREGFSAVTLGVRAGGHAIHPMRSVGASVLLTEPMPNTRSGASPCREPIGWRS